MRKIGSIRNALSCCSFFHSQIADAPSRTSTDASSAVTSRAIVPYVPAFTYIGTTPAGNLGPEGQPEPQLYDQQEIPEDALDIVGMEDDPIPQGSEFIYDQEALVEYQDDRHGQARIQTEQRKSLLIGSVTNVGGQAWVVREDIPIDHTITEDFAEQGLRSNNADIDSLPKRFRSRDEFAFGIRASPRTPKIAERDETKTINAFFMTLYPVNFKQCLKRLNQAILDDPSNRTRKKSNEVSEREYFVFIGILLLAAVQGTGGVEGLYNRKETQGLIEKKQASEYMTKTRFKFIKSYWCRQFELNMSDEEKTRNKWWLDHGFNENRSKTVAASRVLTLDESMSAFRPQTEKSGNLPNISYIMRKPENLGTELKAVSSTSCNGPMIYLEVQEGKEGMRNKPYFSTYGSTSSCTLRLAKGTKNNGNRPDPTVKNLYYGDSWFASFRTAVALKKELDVEFVGVVKTAHKHFPKKYLEDTMKDWPPGTHLILETTKDDEKYFAIGYKYRKSKVICFITTGNAGHTMPGVPYEAKWTNDDGSKGSRLIPRPDVISKYYLHSNQIDKHNHARQGVLAIEKNVVTTCGYFRLFSTYLGITVTDTWKLYRSHLGETHPNKNISIIAFSNILCLTNLLNDYKASTYESNKPLPLLDDQPASSRQLLTFPEQISTTENESQLSSLGSNSQIMIGPGKFIPASFVAAHTYAYCRPTEEYIACKGSYSNRRRKRLKCKRCNKNTTRQCSVCFEWVCASAKSTCFQQHQINHIKVERNIYWESLQG